MTELIAAAGFLARLGFADRRQLMALGERVQRSAHEVLFAQGAPVSRCFSIIEGVVGLSHGIGDARRQITRFALPGDMLDLGAEAHHALTAATIGPALIWEISREQFAQFVSHRPYVQDAKIAAVAADLTDAHAQMFSLGRRPADEKLTTFLIEWHDRLRRIGKPTEPLPLPMSRRDIADYLGLTVETVCRTLARLERRGVLAILPGRVRLLGGFDVDQAAAHGDVIDGIVLGKDRS